jgi:hypothetical protein
LILFLIVRSLLLVAFVMGHIGFWVTLYNRINATGFQRKRIKLIEKGIVLTCLAIPILLIVADSLWHHSEAGRIDQTLREYLSVGSLAHVSSWTLAYGCFAIGCFLVQGPVWLMMRPVFQEARGRYSIEQTHVEKHLHRGNPEWVLGRKSKRGLLVPGNEILSLEANTKVLWFDDLPEAFEGMRIGHFSDIHLTGDLPGPYYRRAVQWLIGQQIELLCLSGDLLDKPECLGTLEEIFSGVPEELSKVFVLGNHDRACGMAEEIRATMVRLGWQDVGVQDRRLSLARGPVFVFGNEMPWFRRGFEEKSEVVGGQGIGGMGGVVGASSGLRIAVSHSPDQWQWGQRVGASLLMCGHTHGGQVRFPWVGPIIAPSHYGSRFASGVFYCHPMIMHVSRGISGVHPLRLGCLPEVSVLELRKKQRVREKFGEK